LRQQSTGEGVGCDNHTPSLEPAAVCFDAEDTGTSAGQRRDATVRIEFDPGAERTLEQAAHVLERVIGAVAWNETREIGCVEPELRADPPARPELDALAVLGGEGDLVAERLFLSLCMRQIQPPARTEVARNALLLNDRLEAVPVPQRHAKDE